MDIPSDIVLLPDRPYRPLLRVGHRGHKDISLGEGRRGDDGSQSEEEENEAVRDRGGHHGDYREDGIRSEEDEKVGKSCECGEGKGAKN